MVIKNKKLQLNIQGKFQQLWTNLFLKPKARRLGLHLDHVKHHSFHQGEIIVSGGELNVWKFIDYTRRPVFFVTLDKVTFKFLD